MNSFDPASLIQTLNKHKEIFICGPSMGNSNDKPGTHLRVYANGGHLCMIPTTPKSEILVDDSFPKYLEKIPEEFNSELIKDYHRIFDSAKGQSVENKNKEREEFFKNEANLNLLFNAVNKKFSKESNSSKERRIQTIIARNHRDFQAHKTTTAFCDLIPPKALTSSICNAAMTVPKEYFTVVCDFEMTAPQKWYIRGSAELKTKDKKTPKCDLVTFSCTQNVCNDPWLISIVELKCNKSACTNQKSGLAAHAREMAICMEETETAPNQTDYIREILRRLGYMLRYGLLKNIPKGLETEVNRLYRESETAPELIRKRVFLRPCFLFTGDIIPEPQDSSCSSTEDSSPSKKQRTGLCHRDAVRLCEKTSYLQNHCEDFFYQFREQPSEANLSAMENWDIFSV